MKTGLFAVRRCASLAAGLFAACFAAAAAAQAVIPCPAGLPDGVTCYGGADANNSYYLIAIPARWNHVLVVHSHGGPRLGAPKPDSEVPDLKRFSVIVKEGFAFAAASYRDGGFIGIATAAEDSENLRKIFSAKFGAPRRTIAHGQSWGGGVTAYLIERYGRTADGKQAYDGAMLTSGLVAGNALGYNFRADLRAVYQYYCRNLPLPTEASYPLWQGLPADSPLTRQELQQRIDDCTGVKTPPGQRTAEQKRNLANITGVIHIVEKSLVGHMTWATFLFRDVVQKRLGGGNPFTNTGVHYAGSDDDAALNRGVARFAADPRAAAAFAADGKLTGKVTMPVLTMHAINDPTVFVEQDSLYRATLERGGRGGRLVQT